ncbi:hypothetical protein [Tautonia plasticadhaerens]|uniref:Nucleotidyltransferase n=1 Tax=Tautonia plasticadhaerens TaxID=2527974 RepID=A0A518GUZ1_9BACT|nr:hypothetical protein [Tautonia plasticadhaerens]QDV32396.1 hypothetical protein ElP_02280 [Tautonia plasticadhaerens]
MPRLTDTTPEADRVLAEVYRRMPGRRKVQLLCGMLRQGRSLHAAGLRQRRPGVTPCQIRDDWIEVHYGAIPAGDRGKESDMVPPPDALLVLRDVIAACASNAIAYALGGSMASTFHGVARFTADADIAVEPFPGREAAFAGSFGEDYYVSVDAIRQAIRDRSSFNVIHTGMAFKVDVFVRKDRPFDTSLMARKRPAELDPDGPPVDLVSAEDIILLKLEWYRLGGETSDRQWGDVLGVLRAQAGLLDEGYLDRWAAELGVADLLETARGEAAS